MTKKQTTDPMMRNHPAIIKLRPKLPVESETNPASGGPSIEETPL